MGEIEKEKGTANQKAEIRACNKEFKVSRWATLAYLCVYASVCLSEALQLFQNAARKKKTEKSNKTIVVIYIFVELLW